MIKLAVSFSLLFVLLFSCTVKPQEINYGTDACDYCQMNIVDKQHSAQYVTKKGKQFKFDAIECMVNDVNDKKHEKKLEFMLVSDYGKNGVMIPAKEATYLISQKIKSPMGAYLSAFKNAKDAEKTKAEMGGEIYTWESLKAKFLSDSK